MKKMPCLFVRLFDARHVATITQQVTPGCEWVLAGEGVPSRKWDGTACLVQGGRLFARYDAKKGKTPPVGAIPCEPAPDPETGHWPHWVLVKVGSNEHRWHLQAMFQEDVRTLAEGTYELVGPKVNGGADGFGSHVLRRHGDTVLEDVHDRSFSGLRQYLEEARIEGIVFTHPDGRRAKIRRADFGFPWPPPPL